MAAREHYTSPIECPKCGQKGVLHLSEDDYPFMRDPRIEIDLVAGAFNAQGEEKGVVRITCRSCGERFKK